jgi:hypothetical protein
MGTFANASRMADCNHLCQHTLCHAVDPRQTDIRFCQGDIIEEENETIGLVLQHDVKESMKSATY